MTYFIIIDNQTIMINTDKETCAATTTTKDKLVNQFKKLFVDDDDYDYE